MMNWKVHRHYTLRLHCKLCYSSENTQPAGISCKKQPRIEILFHDDQKAKGSQPKDICDISQAFLVRDLEFIQNHLSAALLQDCNSSIIKEFIFNTVEENQQAIDQMVS